MHKIPFDVLVHSENALIRAKEMDALLIKLMGVPESGDESESMMFCTIHTLLTPVINELNKAMAIHENNNAPNTGE
ncbi:hypothetical protein [Escherichia coli]|uniref:hypothetical protein n=1 Tax=Escherichia coli TaxID=562 RepID=UPI001F109170|nr:hypothetical protein [Escherichia coli]UMR98305.1 hypothetical protein AOY87_08395 [Escherichia coli]